jgi:hypothetical protein
MPRKKKPPEPQTFSRYAGLASFEMRRRAKEAGCETPAEMREWIERYYGADSTREQNNHFAPGPYRRRTK